MSDKARVCGMLLLGLALVAGSVAAGQQTLAVVEDTWIHGTGSSTPSGGPDIRLGICPVVDYWIYLKFDLTQSACSILGAELRMVRISGVNPSEIAMYPITEDGWSEATLTGINRPEPVDPAPGTGFAFGEQLAGYDRWTSAALAAFVGAEAAGDGIATLMLREDPAEMFDVRYYNSKEAAVAESSKPALVLETAAAEAVGLTLSHDTGTTLGWDAGSAGATWDVIRGDLAQLRLDGSIADAACAGASLATPSFDDAPPDPRPGGGYYFLVRRQDACGAGGYGTSSSGQPRVPGADCPQ